MTKSEYAKKLEEALWESLKDHEGEVMTPEIRKKIHKIWEEFQAKHGLPPESDVKIIPLP